MSDASTCWFTARCYVLRRQRFASLEGASKGPRGLRVLSVRMVRYVRLALTELPKGLRVPVVCPVWSVARCKPFMGKCLRGLELPEKEVENWAKLYKTGMEFVWPAFTSCQLEDGGRERLLSLRCGLAKGLWPFDGNLNFEIEPEPQ